MGRGAVAETDLLFPLSGFDSRPVQSRQTPGGAPGVVPRRTCYYRKVYPNGRSEATGCRNPRTLDP